MEPHNLDRILGMSKLEMSKLEPYQQLEQEWAEFNHLDPKGMVACSSGTAALHLALESLQLPEGCKVVVPDLCMIAIPRAVSMAGYRPVLIDCDPVNLNIDPILVGPCIPPRRTDNDVYGIIVVHTYGRTCNMSSIVESADKGNLVLIEDLAEAHGISPQKRTDVACWSFYKNKVIAGEEGGAVWFRNPTHAELARSLRSLGFTPTHDFMHIPRGHNYRMSNLHASFIRNEGVVIYNENSLRHYQRNIGLRRRIETWYDEFCPDNWKMPPRDVPWVYDIRIPNLADADQDRVVRVLNENGIAARHCFKPVHWQEEYKNCILVQDQSIANRLPISNSAVVCTEVIYLPIIPKDVTVDVPRRAFEIIHRALNARASS